MTKVRVGGEPLIKIRDNGKFLVFDMPRHREFIKQIGFMKFNSSKGWKVLRECITKVATDKIYKFMFFVTTSQFALRKNQLRDLIKIIISPIINIKLKNRSLLL